MKKLLFTIIIILSLIFLFFFWGGSVLTKITIDEQISLLKDSINFEDKEFFTHSSLDNSPEVIKRFFTSTVADSIYKPKLVTVKQTAQFKTDIESEWMPLTATQYFTTDVPNFIWIAEIQNSKLFWVNAIDSYINGKGNMLIKFNSSITIADSWGIELDKSGLFRYISEAVLFPTKLLPKENLVWNILDSNTAEIKFIDNELSVIAKLFFNKQHQIEKIETYDKYRALEDGYEKSLYIIHLSKYKTIEDKFTVPTYIEVEWDLPSGKFKYGKFTIDSVKYE